MRTPNFKRSGRVLHFPLLFLVVMAAVLVTSRSNPAVVEHHPASAWMGGPEGQAQVAPRPEGSLPEADKLDAQDKVEIAAATELRAALGNDVWPGLGAADIPVILFNSRFEFLLGASDPPSPWEKVAGDEFAGRPYFRRPAKGSQAFAVAVGPIWAGSAGTLASMNATSPIKFSPDFHAVMVLHEMFHAFEAEKAPERFAAALATYKSESRYPFQDKDFAEAWTAEGAALAGAIKATDEAETVRQVKAFIEARDARRSKAHLDVSLLAYERELEWLEGLAEYAEISFYRLASGHLGLQTNLKFHPQLPFLLQWDFVRLEKQLSSQGGDLRFYLSGMAQASILDRLSPEWKAKVTMGSFYLEDLLREAVLSPPDKTKPR